MTFSDIELAALAEVLEEFTGLVHDETRRDSLAFAAAQCMASADIPRVSAYLDLLRSPEGAEERQRLIDAVTIQETHFFRNPPQIRALRTHVLPELLRAARSADRPLQVWSAGCSTGEEPYTVAMLVRELLPNATPDQVRILGTDIARSALEAAREARYGLRAVQMAEPVDLARWFRRDGEWFVVRDEIRELVEFRLHNLVSDDPPFDRDGVDLLLCRNVTIYFRRETTKALVRRFHEVLRDGGYLFLGHAETLWRINDEFNLVSLGDAFVYRKVDGRSAGERRHVLAQRRIGADPVVVERRKRPERRQARPERRHGRSSISVAAPRPRPASADAHLAEARAALATGRYGDAVRAATAAARVEPLLVDAHVITGEALVNLGRDDEAISELRQAVYLDPDHAPAHLLLAGALARIGDAVAAGQAYRAAAATVRRLPPERVSEFFAGRDPEELAAVCVSLAQQAERAAARQRRSAR